MCLCGAHATYLGLLPLTTSPPTRRVHEQGMLPVPSSSFLARLKTHLVVWADGSASLLAS